VAMDQVTKVTQRLNKNIIQEDKVLLINLKTLFFTEFFICTNSLLSKPTTHYGYH
jgi:hypothetical protein